jgi:hypothetical protein
MLVSWVLDVVGVLLVGIDGAAVVAGSIDPGAYWSR